MGEDISGLPQSRVLTRGGSVAKAPIGVAGGNAFIEKKTGEGDGGGRRAIIILFLLTVGLSFFFLVQRQLSSWVADFFGPSSWTSSR